ARAAPLPEAVALQADRVAHDPAIAPFHAERGPGLLLDLGHAVIKTARERIRKPRGEASRFPDLRNAGGRPAQRSRDGAPRRESARRGRGPAQLLVGGARGAARALPRAAI